MDEKQIEDIITTIKNQFTIFDIVFNLDNTTLYRYTNEDSIIQSHNLLYLFTLNDGVYIIDIENIQSIDIYPKDSTKEVNWKKIMFSKKGE